MEIKDFSAKDICNIIEKCGKCGVSSLKIGSFEVQFDSSGVERSLEAGKPVTSGEIEPVQELSMSDKDKKLLEQFRIAQDLIDSPSDFEDAVIDRMLEVDKHGENGPKQA